jgi:alpha-1,2-mannosyltransferase
VRMRGGGVTLGYVVQGLASTVTVVSVAWIWRSSTDRDLKAALLLVATLLASPHVLDYDLMILAPAIAFMVAAGAARGFRDDEITLLAAAWIAPLLARGIASSTGIPLGLITVLTLYALMMRRAIITRAGSALGSPGIAQA